MRLDILTIVLENFVNSIFPVSERPLFEIKAVRLYFINPVN